MLASWPALRGLGGPSARAPWHVPHCVCVCGLRGVQMMRDGREVEVRPSRLGLARVSLVRGEGPTKGTCCIDDYIKGAEPVFDYLTKFRWAWRGVGTVYVDICRYR